MKIAGFLKNILSPRRTLSSSLNPSLPNNELLEINPILEDNTASKVLTLRILQNEDGKPNGAARLIFPGFSINPFLNNNIGFLGLAPSSSLVNVSNIYSKSLDQPSQEEIKSIELNPPAPAEIFAAIKIKPLDSEIFGTTDFGLFFKNPEKHEAKIRAFGKEGKKSYTTISGDPNHLYEINPKDLSLKIAKIPKEIIAFGQHKTEEELAQQSKILEAKKEEHLEEQIRKLTEKKAKEILYTMRHGHLSEFWKVYYSEILPKTKFLNNNEAVSSAESNLPNQTDWQPSTEIEAIESYTLKINPKERDWSNSGGD